MRHLEAVIRMFEPGYDVRRIAVRRRNRTNGLFKRGTLFRAALDTLRKAPEPMTTREVVEAMLVAKGIHEPSQKQLRGLFGGGTAAWSTAKARPLPASGKARPCAGGLKIEKAILDKRLAGSHLLRHHAGTKACP